VCTLAMREFNYAYDSNVFLDRCEQCKGIWLDPNEIIDIARHIQYNPEVDAAARGMIKRLKQDHDDEAAISIIIGVVFVILRMLLFKH
jgi:Zn-finger nucleic acid-binding protein